MSTPSSPERPFFLIIAGPNGSGKSSAYQGSDVELDKRSVWIINPDLPTARIRQVEGLELATANVQAVVRIERWLDASIDAHQTVGVETVLSTQKYRRLVERAKKLGLEFRSIYVVLDAPTRNIERVRLRVSKGVHDVPADKIVSRYTRSLAQMPLFLAEADVAWLYDHSSAAPRLIGSKAGGGSTSTRVPRPACARRSTGSVASHVAGSVSSARRPAAGLLSSLNTPP